MGEKQQNKHSAMMLKMSVSDNSKIIYSPIFNIDLSISDISFSFASMFKEVRIKKKLF